MDAGGKERRPVILDPLFQSLIQFVHGYSVREFKPLENTDRSTLMLLQGLGQSRIVLARWLVSLPGSSLAFLRAIFGRLAGRTFLKRFFNLSNIAVIAATHLMALLSQLLGTWHIVDSARFCSVSLCR